MNRLFGFRTLLFAAVAGSGAFAQSTNPDTAAMQALLTEVRQLRLTLEKSLSLGPRMQLVLQRAQLQDQKVARISQQLDEVRKQIAAETARQTAVAERLAKIAQDLSSETDLERRTHMEDMRAGLKMAAATGPDQQMRAHESEIAASLQTEQAILGELNDKLDAIERQFEAAAERPAVKPR